MFKKCVLLISVFLVALTLTSCVELSAPKVKYLNYEIYRVTGTGIEVNFYFDVENPNPIPIDITNYSYKIYINNREFLAENRPGFSLSSSEKKKITLPVNITYDRLIGTVGGLIEGLLKEEKTISYKIEGNISAGALGVIASAPIAASGTIPIPKDIKINL